VVFGKLVVVEIVEGGLVPVTDVDHGDGGIGEVGSRGLTADDGHGVERDEHAAGEELVFVGAAGMREDRGEREHENGREWRNCLTRRARRTQRREKGKRFLGRWFWGIAREAS
jgi:hypothetical protein